MSKTTWTTLKPHLKRTYIFTHLVETYTMITMNGRGIVSKIQVNIECIKVEENMFVLYK